MLAASAVSGIAEALRRTQAQRVYVCNLRPQLPETAGFDVAAHVEALARHGVAIDVVVCDSSQGVPVGEVGMPGGGRAADGFQRLCPQSCQTGAGPLQSAGIGRPKEEGRQ